MDLRNAIVIFVLLFLANTSSFAQNNKRSEKLFEEARNSYSVNKNDDAVSFCEQILKKDVDFYKAHLLLAEVYKDCDSIRLEIEHLKLAAGKTNNTLIAYRLGEAYFKLGMYAAALTSYEEYRNRAKLSEKKKLDVDKKIADCKFAVNSIKNPVDFKPVNMGGTINTVGDEYWPTPTLDGKKMIFTRLLKEGRSFQEDFYEARLDSMAGGLAIPLNGINTPENEGAQTLSADVKVLFFTACNRSGGFGSCDIYFSHFINGEWTVPCNAGEPLNTSSWEGQPSLSSDNRWLYFSSNRPGGKGRKDIWRIRLKGFSEKGMPEWGKPENMDKINTSGDEISPFIHANNHNFYFASDGQVGMGGLDLFAAMLNASGQIDTFKNMGYPINTVKDDMGLAISPGGDVAYFSSAREEGKGQDIFSFNLDNEMRPDAVTYVKASVADRKTAEPLAADIELVNLSDAVNEARTETADKNGQVLLALPVGSNYAFNVAEDGYLFYSQSMQLAGEKSLTDPFVLDIRLEPVEIGAEMNLYNIYFETDSFSILPESEPELNKLVSFLRKNGTLTVEIQGHTDNSGNPGENMELSERRARSVVDYLLERGILPGRLQAKGYGDTRPVADNKTVEGRRLNRRTTIKITG